MVFVNAWSIVTCALPARSGGARAPAPTRSVRVEKTGDIEVADIGDLDAAAGRDERGDGVTYFRRTLNVQRVLAKGPHPISGVSGGEEPGARSGGCRGDAERVIAGGALDADADAAVVARVGAVEPTPVAELSPVTQPVVGVFRPHFLCSCYLAGWTFAFVVLAWAMAAPPATTSAARARLGRDCSSSFLHSVLRSR